MIVAKIEKDHIADKFSGFESLVGKEWEANEGEYSGPNRHFRMYDDDGELYYEGWLIDDDDAMVQSEVLRWGMWDSGCTTLKILNNNNEWEQVIG